MDLKTTLGNLATAVRESVGDELAAAIEDLREFCYDMPEAAVRRRGEDLVADAEALGNRDGFADSVAWVYIRDAKNKLSALD